MITILIEFIFLLAHYYFSVMEGVAIFSLSVLGVKLLHRLNEGEDPGLMLEIAISTISPRKINRTDSEMSLGLTRSKSINRELREFGELCESGKVAVLILKLVAVSICTTVAVRKLTIWYKR